MLPGISKLILKKRDSKYIGKRGFGGYASAGFQMLRTCNCGILPCKNIGIGKCRDKEADDPPLDWPKIAMFPKVEGPFKITKEIRGDNIGCQSF